MNPPAQRSISVGGTSVGGTPLTTRRRAPTVADLLTIAAVLLLAVLLATWMPHQGTATMAVVRHAGGEQQVRLDVTQSFEFAGPRGMTTVQIDAGSIWIAAASCPRQLCRRMGRTNQPTRAVVCIPKRIRIRVLGASGEVDAIAR